LLVKFILGRFLEGSLPSGQHLGDLCLLDFVLYGVSNVDNLSVRLRVPFVYVLGYAREFGSS
jgi:hypothetical protein